MESPWPEKLSNNRKKMTEKLIKGQESTDELQILLRKLLGDRGLATVEDLTEKIRLSFSDTLSLLNSGDSGEICLSPVTTLVSSPFSDDRKTEDSGESGKILDFKDGRGGCKRRKIFQTRMEVTRTPIDDGYSWRKYGQKPILNAKFPRNYFRCTHKHDQGCQAIKQVQQTEDDPPQYRTTYMGHHTCKDTLLVPKLILDSTPRESFILDFQSNITPKQQHPPFPSFHSIKQESKEKIPNDLKHFQSSSSDHLDWPDLTMLDTSMSKTLLSSTPRSDHHGTVTSDMYTCTTSSQTLDMDLIMGSVNFDDDMFHFDDYLIN